jgi:hypothetical protein
MNAPPARRIGQAEQATTPGRWVLRIEGWKPTFDNELVYVHWATARKRKRRDAEAVALAALAAGIPRATGRRRVSLTIRARFRRPPDDPAPLKSTLDALVAAGLLVDDSREWMEFVWPPEFERGGTVTTIVLEDISAAPAGG